MKTKTTKPVTYKQARESLNYIDNINCGGCGIAALALYRWRKAHRLKTYGFSFLYQKYDDWELKHNQRCIESNDLDSIEVPAHIALRVGTRLHDSNGANAKDSCSTPLTQHGINESILLYVINEIDGWNSTFNRRRAIPQIENLLGVDLSDVVHHPG
jgi:hypothetical protein